MLQTHPELLNLHPYWEACCLTVTGERIQTNVVLKALRPTPPFRAFFLPEDHSQHLAASDFMLRLILDPPLPAGLLWVPEPEQRYAKRPAGVNMPCSWNPAWWGCKEYFKNWDRVREHGVSLLLCLPN